MSVLSEETRAILRSAPKRQPEPAHHGIGEAAQWDHATTRGRFRVLVVPATRELVVYDTAAPNGQGDRGRFSGPHAEWDAVARAEECSREAHARGEHNALAAKGLKWDWTDPKTWDKR